MAVTPDGKTLYAGVTFDDKSHGVIRTETDAVGDGKRSSWSVVARTEHQPNGMAPDWQTGDLYCTDEGTGSKDTGGTVFTVNVNTGESTIVKDQLAGADGAWIDPVAQVLYVGKLTTLEIWTYSLKEKKEIGLFPGASSLKGIHMLDDITLGAAGTNATDFGKTLLYGADFTGKQVLSFTLDGSSVESVSPPSGIELYEPTSVRYGKGPGFSERSLYITEGGGATKRVTSRRALQLT